MNIGFPSRPRYGRCGERTPTVTWLSNCRYSDHARPPNATDDPSALPPQTIMTFPVQTLVAPFHRRRSDRSRRPGVRHRVVASTCVQPGGDSNVSPRHHRCLSTPRCADPASGALTPRSSTTCQPRDHAARRCSSEIQGRSCPHTTMAPRSRRRCGLRAAAVPSTLRSPTTYPTRVVATAVVGERRVVPPPQMIIRLPVQTAVCRSRPPGAADVEVGAHVSTTGS
jgi:hypothetical protein